MKTRCYNKTSNKRLDWQNKQITVCDEWRNDFKAFYDWSMNNGYQDNLTIDRIDNNKGYSPENCRWTTYKEQNLNKDCVPTYKYKGIEFHQCDVEKLFGVKRTTFQARLKRGLSIAQAIGKE